MKITKVDVLHLKTGLKGCHWRPIVCRIYTDEGIYGDGEAPLAYGEAQFAANAISTLWGQTILNRALINICHSNFRDELKAKYGKLYKNSKSHFFTGWSASYRMEERV